MYDPRLLYPGGIHRHTPRRDLLPWEEKPRIRRSGPEPLRFDLPPLHGPVVVPQTRPPPCDELGRAGGGASWLSRLLGRMRRGAAT